MNGREDDYDDEPEEPILCMNTISSIVYFIFEGIIDVRYKDMDQPFVSLSEGSYFGEISLINKIRN